MKLINATELLEKYPNIKMNDNSKLMDMCGDLLRISESGKIIRITDCTVQQIRKDIVLKINDYVLIDEGLEESQ